MTKSTARKPEPFVRHHPKDAVNGVARMRRAFGSIPVKGPLPSKRFIEERAERWLTERNRD